MTNGQLKTKSHVDLVGLSQPLELSLETVDLNKEHGMIYLSKRLLIAAQPKMDTSNVVDAAEVGCLGLCNMFT